MATTTEGSQADPAPYWASSGGETRLEESMCKLGLGGGGESYPERPDEADCTYYLKTGYCGYGSRCRFNHPRDRSRGLGSDRPSAVEYPERADQPVCQYYMRTGTCKYGASCKYHHPKPRGGSSSPASLNYYGYPLRLGEQECSYYVRTGHCKFGATCKFHHPEPVGIQGPVPQPQPQVPQIPAAVHPSSLYQPFQSSPIPSSQPYGVVVRPTYVPSQHVGSYSPALLTAGMIPFLGWPSYPPPGSPIASPGAQPAMVPSPFTGITQLSSSAASYTGPYQSIQSSAGPSSTSQKEHSFPQRPGEPECRYYMKTGDCKYGSSCRYHHPLEVTAAKGIVVDLSPVCLPLRPGAPVCTHYAQYGACKFGAACKFDHPIGSLSYSPSASSLADMPVAPYPVGSAVATSAPSSSSSDLRPEIVSGSNMESVSTKVSLSMSTSSESIGSIFSSSGSVPQSSVLQSAPGTSSPSTSGVEAYSSS